MTPAGTRVVGYVRVSTNDQAENGISPEAQEALIRREAEHRGWDVLDVVSDTASGKSLRKRPGLERCLVALEAGFADALVVAKLDRLSRSIIDFGQLLERAQAGGWKIVVLDMELDMTTAAGEMVANVLMAFAQFERRIIGERTKAALDTKRAKGVQLGRPAMLPEKLVRRIVTMRGSGKSFATIARQLNDDAVPTAHGGAQWHPSTVKAVVDRRNRDAHQPG